MVECLQSLREHSDCTILFYGELDRPEEVGVEVRSLPIKWEPERMTQRMKLAAMTGRAGDQVMVFDTDLFFKSDPFQVFDESFDLFYTTRPVPNPLAPVNGGVWGFRCNRQSFELLDFMYYQAHHPNWGPYMQIRKDLRREDRQRELDWWSHQDLLCAMHDFGTPLGAHLHDAGPRYNWCPDSGPGRPLSPQAIRCFYEGFTNPEVVILHYKELEKFRELQP